MNGFSCHHIVVERDNRCAFYSAHCDYQISRRQHARKLWDQLSCTSHVIKYPNISVASILGCYAIDEIFWKPVKLTHYFYPKSKSGPCHFHSIGKFRARNIFLKLKLLIPRRAMFRDETAPRIDGASLAKRENQQHEGSLA